jgi:hypothetical protein
MACTVTQERATARRGLAGAPFGCPLMLGPEKGATEGQSAFGVGPTWVRLVGVACPRRSDGFFIVPNNSKQLLELEILLLALDRGFRVRMSGYDPSTCVTPSVSICATASPCQGHRVARPFWNRLRQDQHNSPLEKRKFRRGWSGELMSAKGTPEWR